MSYEILCWIGGAMLAIGWGLFWFCVGHACATDGLIDRLKDCACAGRQPRVLAQERRTHQSTSEDTPNRRFIDKYAPKTASRDQTYWPSNYRIPIKTYDPMRPLPKTIFTEL